MKSRNDYWVVRQAVCNSCKKSFTHISVAYKYCDQRLPEIALNEMFLLCDECKTENEKQIIEFALLSNRLMFKSFIKDLCNSGL